MGIRRINIIDRASETDEWYVTVPHRIPDLPEYVKINFQDTGMLVKNLLYKIPPNDLRRIVVWEWADQQSYDAYCADPRIQAYEQDKTNFYAGLPNVNVVFEHVENTDQELDLQQYIRYSSGQ